ncbi:hypothetical protein ACFVBP_10435 [Nocardioides sp. NPDC057764]|uniref:hypothetical protein n=1 Tax=Nocardioides sp. NPDC057764 TaxID=3346243 RepID=UPI00366F8E12
MDTANTPKPALLRGRLYLAHDRFVCADCAGITALHTGRTIGGAPLSPVTTSDVREWVGYDLGPLRCEGGHLEASAGATGNLIIRKVA